MTQFEQREQAFENKFGHDEDLEFKIASRAARLFGLWVAEQMGLKGPDAETYANSAVEIETRKDGRAALIAKTEKDCLAKKLSFTHHRLEKEMNDFYSQGGDR